MANQYACPDCDRSFNSKSALGQHRDDKHAGKQLFSSKTKRWLKRGVGAAAAIALLALIVWGVSDATRTLPPTTMAGHIEQSPNSHVLEEPMPLTIQKHMLEHADGDGPPGVIINYNCEDYACAPDLTTRLAAFAEEYPEHVYVAPFANMDAKIVLTRLGQRQILESYDEEAIRAFIEG